MQRPLNVLCTMVPFTPVAPVTLASMIPSFAASVVWHEYKGQRRVVNGGQVLFISPNCRLRLGVTRTINRPFAKTVFTHDHAPIRSLTDYLDKRHERRWVPLTQAYDSCHQVDKAAVYSIYPDRGPSSLSHADGIHTQKRLVSKATHHACAVTLWG